MSAAWGIAAAAAGVYIGLYAAVALVRARYPFELEWMEGATLEHVRRVLAGAPLYARPSLDFVAFTYPPLYYYAAAAVSGALGDGFLALRAVSIAASALSLFLIYSLVRGESGRAPALVAAGLFAATYPLSGAWLDLGRVDALYLCLALLTGTVIARATTPVHFAIGGLCAALALLAKQPIVVSLAFVGPYLLLRHPRGFVYFLVTAVIAGGGAQWYLDVRSDGWFTYYVYELPRLRMAISSRPARAVMFLWDDMARPLAPLLLALAVSAVLLARGWRGSPAQAGREPRIRCVLFALGLLLSSCLARLEGGAWSNALLPAYAGIAILFGLAVRVTTGALMPTAAVAQFVLLAYDPRAITPTARDEAVGRAVAARVAQLPDGVLVLDHGYLASSAGKRSFAHGWAMTDVLWADRRGAGAALEAEARAAIEARRFPALVLDDSRHWFTPLFERHYARSERLPDAAAFWPVSGSRRRPAAIYLPRGTVEPSSTPSTPSTSFMYAVAPCPNASAPSSRISRATASGCN